MSKQSEAKVAQGYIDKAIPQTCGTCVHMQLDLELPKWMQKQGGSAVWDDKYKQETNLRCGIGGFAIKKMGTCQHWRAKPTQA